MHMRFLIAVVFLALASSASAQTSPPTCNRPTTSPRPAPSPQVVAARRAMTQACAADLATFCAGVPPGCGRPMQCLSAHSAQLSAACTTARLNLRAVTHPTPD